FCTLWIFTCRYDLFLIKSIGYVFTFIFTHEGLGGGNAISVENSVYVVTGSFSAFFMPDNVH
ncbi:hypothetical protein LAX08_24025, partial [Escherichia coli]|nr:hypothetical protein [Escherichia coli]